MSGKDLCVLDSKSKVVSLRESYLLCFFGLHDTDTKSYPENGWEDASRIITNRYEHRVWAVCFTRKGLRILL
jgi:hypothetical protein